MDYIIEHGLVCILLLRSSRAGEARHKPHCHEKDLVWVCTYVLLECTTSSTLLITAIDILG